MFRMLLVLFSVLITVVPSMLQAVMPSSDGVLRRTVPPTEPRLTVRAATATLFAPGVTRRTGWYDVNKRSNPNHPGGDDRNLCWAASCTNVIAWFLDRCEATGVHDITGQERDPEKIFSRFKHAFKPEGWDPVHGFSWYFTGEFSFGTPTETSSTLRDPTHPGGGFMKSVLYFCDAAFVPIGGRVDGEWGNLEREIPVMENLDGTYYETQELYSHRSFSENIRRQLHYGPSVLTVKTGATSALVSHAVTLWGCAYDVSTGLVSKIYITDSDDEADFAPGAALKPVIVKARQPDQKGIRLEGYRIDNTPYDSLTGALLFYAPDAIRAGAAVSRVQ